MLVLMLALDLDVIVQESGKTLTVTLSERPKGENLVGEA
jgi:hypothetical protein